MNRNNSIEGCEAKLFIVCPTLRMLLDGHPNPKEIASKSKIEYSNFMKACKLKRDVLLSTYIKCMNAYGRDLILLSLPKGIVESETSPEQGKGDWFYTITQEELIEIERKLHPRSQESLISKSVELLSQMVNRDEELKPLLFSVYQMLQKIFESDESE